VNATDRKILEDIESYGCSVMHIAAEDDLPPFAYSIGITKSSSAPEVVVIGLKQPMAQFVVNEYNRRVRAGLAILAGTRYKGFIEGFKVLAERVDRSFYEEYFGYNLRLNGGTGFEVIQLVYPNTAGVWPWESQASEWFRAWQPVLSLSPTPEAEP
jgi:hypothetical protein